MGRKWLWMVLMLGGGLASSLAGEGAAPPPPAQPLVPPGPAQAIAVQPGPSPTDALDAAPDEVPTHVVKVLRTTNKAQTNRYVIRVYDLKNVNPAAVHRFWRRVAEIEESGHHTFLVCNSEQMKQKRPFLPPPKTIRTRVERGRNAPHMLCFSKSRATPRRPSLVSLVWPLFGKPVGRAASRRPGSRRVLSQGLLHGPKRP